MHILSRTKQPVVLMHDFSVKLPFPNQHFEYTVPFSKLIYCCQGNFLTSAAI
jgi:hypothetical protein